MKTRMIWRYHINSWWGTCAKWAAEGKANGYMVTRERVLWVGKLPYCGDCHWGFH